MHRVRIEDAAIMVSDVAGRLDFICEALGVQAIENYSVEGLEGMTNVVGDVAAVLHSVRKSLDEISAASAADARAEYGDAASDVRVAQFLAMMTVKNPEGFVRYVGDPEDSVAILAEIRRIAEMDDASVDGGAAEMSAAEAAAPDDAPASEDAPAGVMRWVRPKA